MMKAAEYATPMEFEILEAAGPVEHMLISVEVSTPIIAENVVTTAKKTVATVTKYTNDLESFLE